MKWRCKGSNDILGPMTFEEMCILTLSRKREMPEGKSTTALFEKGAHAIGKKLVEEAAESWMAARYEGREAVAQELSQVLYYVACMMAETGVTEQEVYRHL
jgi:phosphoribosyl-ATP pyrophosphohydrolase